jgi:hypothetical protein
MPVLTGANGAMTYGGQPVTCVRSWSLDISRDALETTCLGVYDRTFVEGLRGATGTAVLLYDPASTNVVAILNRILANNAAANAVEFILNSASTQKLAFTALVVSTSTPMNVGEVVAVNATFTVTGAITGNY